MHLQDSAIPVCPAGWLATVLTHPHLPTPEGRVEVHGRGIEAQLTEIAGERDDICTRRAEGIAAEQPHVR